MKLSTVFTALLVALAACSVLVLAAPPA